jgi:phosphomannomutase
MSSVEDPRSTLKFGTSGLRGLAIELDGRPASEHSLAFARVMLSRGEIAPGGRVLLGRDLRPSSPSIMRRCAAGLVAAGLIPVDCSLLPTPALAAHALKLGAPAIMVTGSHIPEDRNGLKFYRRDGEIDKHDEADIVAGAARAAGTPLPATDFEMASDPSAIGAYIDRAISMLAPDAFKGMRIGVYQHSSVARDLMVEVFTALGAETIPLGRSDIFVPVDTEALRPEDEALALGWVREHQLDALVSTDGDADRPLIADETGRFLRGDLVGAVAAAAFGADCVVTPVSSNSGIERCRRFARVLRTRIGSPYVIDGMHRVRAEGAARVIGFEANGGVLVGSPVEIDSRALPTLPTRDALAPILAVLHWSRRTATPLSALAEAFRFSAAASGRLKDVPASATGPFLERLLKDRDFRYEIAGPGFRSHVLDTTDGVRMIAEDGTVLHYRASGNAPELRCYVEVSTAEAAAALLSAGLAEAGRCLGR